MTIYFFDGNKARVSGKLNSLLSDNSFPSLQELALDRLPLSRTLGVMHVEHLVRRLTTLRLGLEEEGFALDEIDDHWYSGFLNLFKYTPCLRHFALDVYGLKTFVQLFDNPTFQLLVELPFQSLVLRGISLEHVEFAPEGAEAIWSNLVELRTPDCIVSFSQLWNFAIIPNLRYLKVTLLLINPQDPGLFREISPVGSLEVIRFNRGEMCSRPEEVDFIAGTLLSYWPNLKRIEWGTPASLAEELDNQLAALKPSETPE
ncbi:hypothetical protein FRC07_006515 [Ceratobasidium sp. 392]|nr:hypothetical protein FRC07_006515 [Ceratobasidium sp. 392]